MSTTMSGMRSYEDEGGLATTEREGRMSHANGDGLTSSWSLGHDAHPLPRKEAQLGQSQQQLPVGLSDGRPHGTDHGPTPHGQFIQLQFGGLVGHLLVTKVCFDRPGCHPPIG